MSPIMSPVSAGRRNKEVTIESLVTTPDGDGGFVELPTAIATVHACIEAATPAAQERATSGTVIAQASHLVTIPYVFGVTAKSRVIYGTRILNVVAQPSNPDEANRELVLTCVEVIA
jgi:SPP1 family predicted phage head-tail adaptor